MGWCSIPEKGEAAEYAKRSCSGYGYELLSAKRVKELAGNLVKQWAAMAKTKCGVCSRPIGWGGKYYMDDAHKTDDNKDGMIHFLCELKRIEAEKAKRDLERWGPEEPPA